MTLTIGLDLFRIPHLHSGLNSWTDVALYLSTVFHGFKPMDRPPVHELSAVNGHSLDRHQYTGHHFSTGRYRRLTPRFLLVSKMDSVAF
jgi:hypothetical protein